MATVGGLPDDTRMNNITSNQRYGGLNRRFEKRAALLRRFGFVYIVANIGEEKNAATFGVFTRTPFWRSQAITAAEVMHADRQVWIDELSRFLRH